MKVISGIYKGKIIKGYEIEGTRPTKDRVKESLMARIAPYVKNKDILDLFAGIGSLGIEALSLGATTCTFVDKSKDAIYYLKENTKGIKGTTIIFNDYHKYLKEIKDTFDLIFLDPPYHAGYMQKAIDKIIEKNILKEGGILVCEYEDEKFHVPLELIHEKKYGKTKVQIYKK